jgi:hypothetical protein
LKLLVDEPGTDEATALWNRARLAFSTRLLYPEARAAVAAAARGGRTGSRGVTTLREELEGFWRDVSRIEVTPALAARAGDLAEEHGLRGYDAVHLSSALEIGAADMVLVSSDGRMARAAEALGLMTARLPAQSSAG